MFNNPNLFLIIIASALVWQIINSHALAKSVGQTKAQALAFSLIIAVGIFLSVANGVIVYAVFGSVIEAGINILLVARKYANLRKNSPNNTRLNYGTEVFIGILVPGLIFSLSELYISLVNL